ncbi:MarR family winged helix-turn-helix transcriptional regulator [Cupriavidus consociatus]|uniref:MarR family winged helix-turn-helix transcriptional regulator n=1 Tax=Cupriavidus consociatus TaxID=2821357 RepID=UPI001AE80848|nr:MULTISPECIES: MarR family winged helix-turn-helix transcriptional regulator [unclassified Cupriavidus]MBP0619308.1 winged helix-turn-helix transcriptional regulator [Cupriavidus sp. LEh25]MDK2655956.1 MarR family winged helix-turn-helix transcriptional regulator [Cupriavidus sp. LEh21]
MKMGKQGARTLRADADAALDVDLGWWSRLLARRVTAALDEALAPSGLTSTQFGLMCLIASATDDTLGALAQRAGLNQSTMSRNVDQLVGTGMVEVVMTEADRRRRAVWLTETGALSLQQALALWQPAHRALLRKLGLEAHNIVGEVAAKLAE